MSNEITAEFIRNLVDYDPETGVFTYREDRICGRGRVNIKAGDVAGTKRPNGYRLININLKPMLSHRLAWLHFYGEWPKNVIDHINGDPSDNRIKNLRDVTFAENMQNIRKSPSSRKIGTLLGASLYKPTNRWRAYLRVDNKQKHLGYFATEEEAHAAHIEAKRKFHKGCTI